jgi:integrase
MATIFKRTGKKGITWQVKIRRQGKMQTASFSTRKQAEDWSRNLENSIEMEKYFPTSTQKPLEHTVAELLDLYEQRIVSQHSEGTQGTYGRCLKYWRSALGDTPVKHVSPSLIEECRYYLLHTKGLDPQTVNLYVNAVSPAFTYAASESLNWIQRNPFSRVKKLKEKPDRAPQLTDQQVQDLLDWCDRSQSPHLWLFARVILATGARKNEALTLKWSQINLKQKHITFTKTKSRKQRTVPLPSFLVEILKDVYNERFPEEDWWKNFPDGEYVFPSARDPRKPAVNIHAAWNRARRRSGIDIRIHDGRHVAASNFILKGGADILTVSTLLGHANLRETQRYVHLTHGHFAGVVEQMANAVFQKRA